MSEEVKEVKKAKAEPKSIPAKKGFVRISTNLEVKEDEPIVSKFGYTPKKKIDEKAK
jgi:hypothetical protein